jgi:hypothetical protein
VKIFAAAGDVNCRRGRCAVAWRTAALGGRGLHGSTDARAAHGRLRLYDRSAALAVDLRVEDPMYATLSYDLSAGPEAIEAVRESLLKPFDGREVCDLLADTFVCAIDNTADYLELVKDLKAVARDFPGQLEFVFTLHRAGDPLRSNANFPSSKVRKILGSGGGA